MTRAKKKKSEHNDRENDSHKEIHWYLYKAFIYKLILSVSGMH
jgi:hypothetical protein